MTKPARSSIGAGSGREIDVDAAERVHFRVAVPKTFVTADAATTGRLSFPHAVSVIEQCPKARLRAPGRPLIFDE